MKNLTTRYMNTDIKTLADLKGLIDDITSVCLQNGVYLEDIDVSISVNFRKDWGKITYMNLRNGEKEDKGELVIGITC